VTRSRQSHVTGALGRQMSQVGEPAPGRSIQAPPQRRYPGRIISPQRAHRHDPAITQRLFRLLRTRRAVGGRHVPASGFGRYGRPALVSIHAPSLHVHGAPRKLCPPGPSPGSLRLPDGTLAHPQIVYVQHADDPVVWWSPSLALQEPGWLAGPHGSGVIPQMRWYPLVTFWQVTADLIVSTSVPPGHGHDYGPEIPTAWGALLDPPGWTSAGTATLTALEAASSLP